MKTPRAPKSQIRPGRCFCFPQTVRRSCRNGCSPMSAAIKGEPDRKDFLVTTPKEPVYGDTPHQLVRSGFWYTASLGARRGISHADPPPPRASAFEYRGARKPSFSAATLGYVCLFSSGFSAPPRRVRARARDAPSRRRSRKALGLAAFWPRNRSSTLLSGGSVRR